MSGRWTAILSATGACLLAAACASQEPAAPRHIYTTSADYWKPQVTQETARLDLAPDFEGAGLNPLDATPVAAFMREYRKIGHGALVLHAPRGVNAFAMAEDIRLIGAETGVRVPYVGVVASDPEGAGSPFHLTFTRYEAHARPCGEEWESLANTRRSETFKNFGCATNANTAAMIADPADLVWPREMTPADGARRQAVLDAYRNGEVTASARSGDDASISGIGN